MTNDDAYSVQDRAEAALRLLRIWAEDTATAQEFPGAVWTVDEDANLQGVADSNEGAEIWAEYVGIDLDRTEAGVLSGSRVSTPDGPFGPKIKVTVTVRKGD